MTYCINEISVNRLFYQVFDHIIHLSTNLHNSFHSVKTMPQAFQKYFYNLPQVTTRFYEKIFRSIGNMALFRFAMFPKFLAISKFCTIQSLFNYEKVAQNDAFSSPVPDAEVLPIFNCGSHSDSTLHLLSTNSTSSQQYTSGNP